ncbi:MAG: ATP-binding cassette domain-containing protein [Polyangiaceae bacterium]|nr:ATP-binding cassette domain-containing protein [Polyangiaceae bacterium]
MTSRAALELRVEARVGRLRVDVELEAEHETLVLVGPNGAGKSSLLGHVIGALPVDRGRIVIDGAPVFDSSRGIDLAVEERRIGYLPQDYALFPHLDVRQNLDFALACASPRRSREERRSLAETLLQELGLSALASRRPRALSGGERQRVALARALAASPRVLLLDEPLAALDVRSRGEVRAFLAEYLAQLGLPALVVTHDPEDARRLGRRVAVLEEGRVTQLGTWAELEARPASPFVEQLVAGATRAAE